MPIPTLPRAAKSSAPAQYLGFSLQQVRLCYYLLSVADGIAVSLEHIDDVGVHRPDGTALFEQAKSTLGGKNPASNKSEELWKTFGNWADTCLDSNIDPSTSEFRYYVSDTKAGALLTAISKADSPAEAEKVLKKIKELFEECETGTGCEPHLARFLKAGDAVCCAIIQQCSFHAEADPVAAIRDRLNVLPVDAIDDFCAAAIGLAVDDMDELIRQRQTPAIEASAFRKRFWAFVRKHNFSNVLTPSIDAPEPQAIDRTLLGAPLFVRQLNAIEASNIMLVTAVSDYMRTTADKVKWADDGAVYADSFSELDEQLVRRHLLVCDEVDDTQPVLAVPDRGRRVYRECSNTGMPLEGQTLPSYFIAGAFNCLAQTRRVGWHPKYLTLFPPE
ncbi:hypothetical protein NKI61_31705 [Mesorhizobium sp. M0514]|uniref:ABC-three component system protein n=1 Tax=Mesorhizobium sp. M0514 TaxID=2956955 RepID=UPI00333CE4E0